MNERIECENLIHWQVPAIKFYDVSNFLRPFIGLRLHKPATSGVFEDRSSFISDHSSASAAPKTRDAIPFPTKRMIADNRLASFSKSTGSLSTPGIVHCATKRCTDRFLIRSQPGNYGQLPEACPTRPPARKRAAS